MAPANPSSNGQRDCDQGSMTVQVKNIPENVQTGEILALFQSLIGEIRCFQESKDDDRTALEITFYQQDHAMKALCIKGYSIGGVSLDVSRNINPAPSRQKRPLDDRRNLYVLGLPFALTKSEFASLFSRFGTVVHCVILATVDNSSRRRGFVVMSSHEEAKRALTGLSRAQIKGHTIDVSWAVVQRSQGFLDGGDRAMLLDPRSSVSPGPGYPDRLAFSSSGSDSSEHSPMLAGSDYGFITNNAFPTTTLLITNLPVMLFSQVQDLHPLLCPFGKIERIQITQLRDFETVSAVVQYATSTAAAEARNSLHGQVYDALRHIEVQYVHQSFGDHTGDLRLSGPNVNHFDDVPTYTTSRAPSPFYVSNSANPPIASSPRSGEKYGGAPYAHGSKERFDGRPNPSSMRSRATSPRSMFLSNQSRRIQGGFHSGFQGFTT